MNNIFNKLKLLATPEDAESYELIKDLVELEKYIFELEEKREEIISIIEKRNAYIER